MSMIDTKCESSDSIPTAEGIHFPAYIDTIFEQLRAQDVEQFYSSYKLWSLQRRMRILQTEITIIQQAIDQNAELMQDSGLSPITLANLAQLQAYGVNNVDLLDRMSDRGEGWLDHTMQLLKYCEDMDVIRGNYAQWCEHALDGAYNWIASIPTADELTTPTAPQTADELTTPTNPQTASAEPLITEEELLQKLMSDGGDTEKMPALGHNFGKATEEPAASTDLTDKMLVVDTTQTIHPDDTDEEPASGIVEDIDLPLTEISSEDEIIESPLTTPPTDIAPSTLEDHIVQDEMATDIAPITLEHHMVQDEVATDIAPITEHHMVQDDEATDTSLTLQENEMEVVLPDVAVEQTPVTEETIAHEEDDVEDMPDSHVDEIIVEGEVLDKDEEEDTAPRGIVAGRANNQVNESVVSESSQVIHEEKEVISDEAATNDTVIVEKIQSTVIESTRTQSLVTMKSTQESKKASLQKVQRKGFWWFLRKLLLSILRR